MDELLVPGFILIVIAEAGKGDRPHQCHSPRLEVVAQVFNADFRGRKNS
jgi:hypothetical protein